MNDSSVDLEMQPPTHPLPKATGSEEEESQQCWKDVKAETGYSSYKSFLEALPDSGPQFKALREEIEIDEYRDTFGKVHVYNILRDGGVSISINLRGCGEDTGIPYRNRNRTIILDNDLESCAQLVRNLRSPPDNTQARIIVWLIPRSFNLHPGLVDAIGLGLKIQPAIFDILLSMVVEGTSKFSCRRLGPDYVIIGNSIATVVRNYIPNGRVPPALFVAKVHDGMTDSSSLSPAPYKFYDDMVIEALTTEIYGSILPCRAANEMRSLEDLAPDSSGYLDRLSNHVYLNILRKYVQKGAGVDAQNDSPLQNAILPLLHLEVLHLHAQCRITQRELLLAHRATVTFYKQLYYQTLDVARFELRRMLEGLEESKIGFVKFARLQNLPKWLEGRLWMEQEEEIIKAVSEARAVEAEARDFMQLEIGNLSILESRKSIQLSNQQMSEAKRGKSREFIRSFDSLLINSQLRYVSKDSPLCHDSILTRTVTILAFVYVPINLATSVFGMNLQELNQNGQKFWSFVVTAIAALLITGSVWSSLELYNVVREHKYRVKRMRTHTEEPKVRVGVRVAIFLGLIKEDDLDRLRRRGYE